jgi:hypothetical protein
MLDKAQITDPTLGAEHVVVGDHRCIEERLRKGMPEAARPPLQTFHSGTWHQAMLSVAHQHLMEIKSPHAFSGARTRAA